MAAAERLAGMGVDMLWTGDDIGSQRGMLIAPATWRRFLKPRMAELIARVKAIKPDLLVAYHTDGDVREVIDDLIEIGIDVLNPVQPACMDPAELKRDYGDRLLFWGSIDEQKTLPFGRPEDVARRDPPAARHHRSSAADSSSARRTMSSSTPRSRTSGRWWTPSGISRYGRA